MRRTSDQEDIPRTTCTKKGWSPHHCVNSWSRRYTERGISHALAWDDITGMKVDAGEGIEARDKEVQYVQDGSIKTYPEERPNPEDGTSLNRGGLISIRVIWRIQSKQVSSKGVQQWKRGGLVCSRSATRGAADDTL